MKKLILGILAGAMLHTAGHAADILKTDIVDTAINAGSFKTLIAAVQAAKLESVFRGPGPLTVFAPTDTAFAKLPAGLVASLLKDPAALRKLLLGHAVFGKELTLSAIENSAVFRYNGYASSAPFLLMASGQAVTLSCGASSGCKANVGGSKYVATDINASNGVIQAVDTVLSPTDFISQ